MQGKKTEKYKSCLPSIKRQNTYQVYQISLNEGSNQGRVVQSIVSLTSSLVVKMLIVLVSTISNSHAYCRKICKSYWQFFSKNVSIYAIFNDQSFNDTLTNDNVSFEQVGSDCWEGWSEPSLFAYYKSPSFVIRLILLYTFVVLENIRNVLPVSTVFTISIWADRPKVKTNLSEEIV